MTNPIFAEIEPYVEAVEEIARIDDECKYLINREHELRRDKVPHEVLLHKAADVKVTTGPGEVLRLSGLSICEMQAEIWLHDFMHPVETAQDMKKNNTGRWARIDKPKLLDEVLLHPAVSEESPEVYNFDGQWAAIEEHKLFLYANANRWVGSSTLMTGIRAHVAEPDAVRCVQRAA